jgi:hypothetical protein
VACIYFVYPSKFKPKNSRGLGIQNYDKKNLSTESSSIAKRNCFTAWKIEL